MFCVICLLCHFSSCTSSSLFKLPSFLTWVYEEVNLSISICFPQIVPRRERGVEEQVFNTCAWLFAAWSVAVAFCTVTEKNKASINASPWDAALPAPCRCCTQGFAPVPPGIALCWSELRCNVENGGRWRSGTHGTAPGSSGRTEGCSGCCRSWMGRWETQWEGGKGRG